MQVSITKAQLRFDPKQKTQENMLNFAAHSDDVLMWWLSGGGTYIRKEFEMQSIEDNLLLDTVLEAEPCSFL